MNACHGQLGKVNQHQACMWDVDEESEISLDKAFYIMGRNSKQS